ncbi:MAG: CCA tRNA nucleotidyltransferase [Bacilli bacterium]|jgi:tRNA nucleotidyltransferase (CCA-adding enzyme)|nr:CCA tRNA nucleotidyltransferase [Bacilli bacterium]MDY0063490.1 CCA tRNA nucleotidyltransferase [Bacilli bacterium]
MKLPKDIDFILKRFETAHYQAFVVGGAVRDYLLNKKPLDYDIATNATPGEIKTLFADKKTFDTGIKHGTVSVMIKKRRIEITTFRQENKYEKYRRPDQVVFVHDLEKDLSRRDFTMNAIAYHNQMHDYFNGVEDIKNKIIRCVGDPSIRFQEDALRILRALRFSCQLGFQIEEQTKKAIFDHKQLLIHISKERILDEWTKMIQHDISYVIPEYNSVLQTIMPSITQEELLWFAHFNHRLKDDVLKATALVLRSKKTKLLENLNYPKKIIKQVNIILNYIDVAIPNHIQEIKKILMHIHKTDLLRIVKIQKLLKIKTCSYSIINKIPEEKYELNYLAITGTDLLKAGFPSGDIIAYTLHYLLEKVLEEKIVNKKEYLIGEAVKIKKMQ